jgi:hypothetical protein
MVENVWQNNEIEEKVGSEQSWNTFAGQRMRKQMTLNLLPLYPVCVLLGQKSIC